MNMNEKTIVHHLLHRKDDCPKDLAIQYKSNDRWMRYTWSDYYNLINTIGSALASHGLKKDSRVAIISETRPEWAVIDFAVLGIGAVTVPIYPNNLEDDVEFIINNAEVEFLFVEDKEQLQKWQRICKNCQTIKNVVVIDDHSETEAPYLSWASLLRHGRKFIETHPRHFSDSMKQTARGDIATILYTSGTTGRPKGVVLTHEQIMSELEDVYNVISVGPNDISLTFLPYSHVLGRVEAWGSVYAGYSLAFAESIDRIKYNLKEIKPTFLIAVPRIFEKIYGAILSQVENQQIKRKIFEQALAVGKRVSAAVQEKRPLGLLLTLEFEIAKKLVFDKINQQFGGRLRFAVSGGAPLSAEISRFFHGIGLLICEGYGLTETTAGVCFNTPLHYKFGTVGKPLADVQVKIAPDGEILIKSKKVMREYYKNPEATKEVFTDGFFHTGDIGHLDKDGYLLITDRKKDLIKTAGGKYVAPQKLENLLKQNPNISNVLIHGDQKKYIIALLTVAPHLKDKAKETETYNIIRDAVADANTQLASFESIKKFAILPNEFTVESGELTPSLKVKRKFCDQKFKDVIDQLY